MSHLNSHAKFCDMCAVSAFPPVNCCHIGALLSSCDSSITELEARLQAAEVERDEAKSEVQRYRDQWTRVAETNRNLLAKYDEAAKESNDARAEVERLRGGWPVQEAELTATRARAESAERRLQSVEKVVEAASLGCRLYEGQCLECGHEPDVCILVKCELGPIRKALAALDATGKEAT